MKPPLLRLSAVMATLLAVKGASAPDFFTHVVDEALPSVDQATEPSLVPTTSWFLAILLTLFIVVSPVATPASQVKPEFIDLYTVLEVIA
jgi:hypothetical protein